MGNAFLGWAHRLVVCETCLSLALYSLGWTWASLLSLRLVRCMLKLGKCLCCGNCLNMIPLPAASVWYAVEGALVFTEDSLNFRVEFQTWALPIPWLDKQDSAFGQLLCLSFSLLIYKLTAWQPCKFVTSFKGNKIWCQGSGTLHTQNMVVLLLLQIMVSCVCFNWNKDILVNPWEYFKTHF